MVLENVLYLSVCLSVCVSISTPSSACLPACIFLLLPSLCLFVSVCLSTTVCSLYIGFCFDSKVKVTSFLSFVFMFLFLLFFSFFKKYIQKRLIVTHMFRVQCSEFRGHDDGHVPRVGQLTSCQERKCFTHWRRNNNRVAAPTCLELSSSHSYTIEPSLSVSESSPKKSHNCWIKMAIERVVFIVCACLLVNRGLSLKSRRHVDNDVFVVTQSNGFEKRSKLR